MGKKTALQQAAEDLHAIQGMCMSYGNDPREELEALRKRIHQFTLESIERIYDECGVKPKSMEFGREPSGHPRPPFYSITAKPWEVTISEPLYQDDIKQTTVVIMASDRKEAMRVAEQQNEGFYAVSCKEQ